jgi:AraC family transcriptional regulator
MIPSIRLLPDTKLVGMRVQMNFLENKIPELWRGFMPMKREIENSVGTDLYSVEIYSDLTYFEQFNPAREFEKWAAVKVNSFENIPEKMEKLLIPESLYAVFPFKGKDEDASKMYQYIIGKWIPESIYELDHRPHFALMGEKYKNNDPNSEEEIWIPIKPKSNV